MKTATLECGCKYEVGDRERWLTLCPEHDKETRETHERWAREHKQQTEVNHELR